jgi:hypothetical protein
MVERISAYRLTAMSKGSRKNQTWQSLKREKRPFYFTLRKVLNCLLLSFPARDNPLTPHPPVLRWGLSVKRKVRGSLLDLAQFRSQPQKFGFAG